MAGTVTQHVLAKLLLDWGDLHQELAALEGTIEKTVLALGKTVIAGNVRARYSKGRKSYDYKAGVLGADPPVEPGYLASYTTQPSTPAAVVGWKAVCQGLALDVPFKQGKPRACVLWEGD